MQGDDECTSAADSNPCPASLSLQIPYIEGERKAQETEKVETGLLSQTVAIDLSATGQLGRPASAYRFSSEAASQ